MSSSTPPGDGKSEADAETVEGIEDAEVVETASDEVVDATAEVESEIDELNEELDAEIEPADDDHHHDDSHQGSGFAATALKFLMIVLVVFAVAAWLVPRAAPWLPAPLAKHLMPGQQALDDKLAQVDALVAERTQATDDAVAAMQTQIDALTARLEAAETSAAEASAAAAAAEKSAAASANAASGNVVAEEVVVQAEAAARDAAQTAATATTAATEAGKVASAATRDTASLARRMTAFEARLNGLSDELAAMNQSLANSAGSGGAAAPELGAALAALQAKVEGLGGQIAETQGLITEEDAARFATQDDLRSARTALGAEMAEALGRFPAPETVATDSDLDAARKGLAVRVNDLAERVARAEAAATEAQTATTTAVGQVEGAIRDASLRSAVAALTSRMQNGVAFANAADEIERLTGKPVPEALRASADSGVATPEWLLRGWGRRAQAALAADIEANADEGVLGQASARLRSVVSGRPKNEQQGDDAASVISRIEARLKDGALDAALTEAESLPEASQAALGDWLDRLRARVSADQAAAAYIADLGAS